MNQTRKRISNYSLALVIYALIIILWGAWVRISGSGDGCGVHWPLCHGSYLPEDIFKHAQTAIEFIHRAKSGLFGLLVLYVWFKVRKEAAFSKLEKKIAWCALIFTCLEALLGAKLVLFSLVGSDSSNLRFLTVGLHLVNTLFLVGSLVCLWITTQKQEAVEKITLLKKDYILLTLFMLTAAIGAVASLS